MALHRSGHRGHVAAIADRGPHRPSDDPHHPQKFVTHRRMPANDPFPKLSYQCLIKPCRPAEVGPNQAHQHQRGRDHDRGLDQIRHHHAHIAGEHHIDQDDRNDQQKGLKARPAQERLGHFRQPQKPCSGPSYHCDKGTAQRDPSAHRRRSRTAKAELVKFRRGKNFQPPPARGEEQPTDHQRQPEAAQIPPADKGPGDDRHAAIRRCDVGVHAGDRIASAAHPPLHLAPTQEVIFHALLGESPIVQSHPHQEEHIERHQCVI